MRSESLAVRKPADDAVVSMAPNWIRLPFLTQTRTPADNPVMTAPLALSRVEQRGILPDAEDFPQDAYDRGKHALGTRIPQALPRPGPPLGGWSEAAVAPQRRETSAFIRHVTSQHPCVTTGCR